MNRACVLVSFCVLCLTIPAIAGAQSGRRIEAAAHAAIMRFDDFGTTTGVGGRVTFDLSPSVGIEGELNVFPRDNITVALGSTLPRTGSLVYHRRRTDALVGAKLGYRNDRFGVFGRLRPGVAWLENRGVGCGGEVCPLILIAPPEYRREFVFDFGGTVEFYPSARSVARLDLGDMMIRHRSLAPPCSRCTTHNFTSRVGGGIRF